MGNYWATAGTSFVGSKSVTSPLLDPVAAATETKDPGLLAAYMQEHHKHNEPNSSLPTPLENIVALPPTVADTPLPGGSVVDVLPEVAIAFEKQKEAVLQVVVELIALAADEQRCQVNALFVIDTMTNASKGLRNLLTEADPLTRGPQTLGGLPKRLCSNPYILFCNEYRPQLAVDHPGLTAQETVSTLASMWRQTDQSVWKLKSQQLRESRRSQDKDTGTGNAFVVDMIRDADRSRDYVRVKDLLPLLHPNRPQCVPTP